MFSASGSYFVEFKTIKEMFAKIFWILFIIGLVYLFAPNLIPWTFFGLWKPVGSLSTWLSAGTPIFIWAVAVTILLEPFRYKNNVSKYQKLILKFNNPEAYPSVSEIIFKGTLTSFWAGISEEVYYRWLGLMGGIGISVFMNFLFFGFLGFGIPEAITNYITAPLANFFTGGYLANWLAESPWYIACAILTINADFREGHQHLGIVGLINSWFIGMFLFWIMFSYGLLAAIVIHIIYDLIIYSLFALSIAVRRPW